MTRWAHVLLLALTVTAFGLAEFAHMESGHRLAVLTALLTSLPALWRMVAPPPPNYLAATDYTDGEHTPVERPQKP